MNEANTEEAERVLDILIKIYLEEEENPLCYFEFVLDPNSFGQTVENIFHVSFLIRDGLAELFLDADGLPVIKPVEKKDNSTQSIQGEQKRHQAVITITPVEWKKLVDTFKVEQATISPRRPGKSAKNG